MIAETEYPLFEGGFLELPMICNLNKIIITNDYTELHITRYDNELFEHVSSTISTTICVKKHVDSARYQWTMTIFRQNNKRLSSSTYLDNIEKKKRMKEKGVDCLFSSQVHRHFWVIFHTIHELFK